MQTSCAILGRPLTITLIGRRSNLFAGTRYLKRGVDDDGNVANDVEVEQIVDDHAGRFASFVQYRGSIPVYWTQETSVARPKPPIMLCPRNVTNQPGRRHFQRMMARYGGPILVLDLVKKMEKKAREVRHMHRKQSQRRAHYGDRVGADTYRFVPSVSSQVPEQDATSREAHSVLGLRLQSSGGYMGSPPRFVPSCVAAVSSGVAHASLLPPLRNASVAPSA